MRVNDRSRSDLVSWDEKISHLEGQKLPKKSFRKEGTNTVGNDNVLWWRKEGILDYTENWSKVENKISPVPFMRGSVIVGSLGR